MYSITRSKYTDATLPIPEPMQINGTTDRYLVVWLQLALNRQFATGYIQGAELTVDEVYDAKTVRAAAGYWQRKGWSKEAEVWIVGKGTLKALGKV